MHYRGYRDKTDTAQLRVRGRVAWGTSIWARKKVISLAEEFTEKRYLGADQGSLPGGGSIWAIVWRMSRRSLGKGLFSWMSWFSATHIYYLVLPQRHSPPEYPALTSSPQPLSSRSTTSNPLPTGIYRLLGIPLRSYQGKPRRANCSGPLFPCFF